MKLLIVTQVVDRNHSNLGFFHRWIEEFAGHAEQVQVICLYEGEHSLSKNVTVHSLGKERGAGRVAYLWRFYRYIWQLRHGYDAVLVHMNPEYVVLGGLLWRLWGKRVGLWYMHRSVTWWLRAAARIVHHIFTASPESCRVNSSKIIVTGHGIDLTPFETIEHVHGDGRIRLVSIGRVSASKGVAEMIDTQAELSRRGARATLVIAGGPLTAEDDSYTARLKEHVGENVTLLGPIQRSGIPALLANAEIFLNLSNTGSLDKAVLEALAAGVPAISSNEAFKIMLEPHGLFVQRDPVAVADAIEQFLARDDRATVVAQLQQEVREQHSLQKLVPRILERLA